MRLIRHLSFVAVLLGIFALAAVSQITVGVLSEDATRFQPYVTQATQAGLRVSLDKFSESALHQQVYTLAALGQARIDVAECLTKWLPQVQGRLLDLAPYAQELQAAGVELYAYGNVIVGVKLPWRADAFLGILARSRNIPQALEFLKLFRAEAPGVTPLSLSLGPLVVAKPAKRHAGVDGALEGFVGVLRQAVPQGLIVTLSRVPAQAQDALRRVAEMWGIPLSADGASVTVVLEPLEPVAPTALGATYVEASALGLQKAVVPLDQLESFLAQAAGKARVRLPFEPIALAATSEGVHLVGAAAFQARGIRGAGVKIAVIDVGFAGLSQSQARNDLPHALVTRDFTGTGMETGLSHGTAVAEIVYDIAPAATLYLLKIGNEVDLDNAITYCITEGVHIIVHALGWFNTSFYDGTGTIARIVNRAAGAGILWVQAAGNFGLRHYGATFTDTNGDGWHDTEVTFTASAGERILLYLTWDSWPQTADDYDLYLFGPAGNLLASSTKTQAGAEQPTERVYAVATTSGAYRVRIQRVSGTTKGLALFSVYHNLSPHDPASSLVTPADVEAALSVAAIGWPHYATGPAQPYSSRGPTRDGRQKPDLSGPDNVTTGVSFYNPFPGTSAAASHVAGVAALLKAETPGLSARDLRARLLSFCVPMGDPYTYGAGRLEARPQPVAQPDLIIDSLTYTPATPAVGATVNFTVVVRNQGNAMAGAFTVRLQGAGPSQDRTVPSLAAGATTTLTFSLPLSTTPETFTATADVLGQVAESNEGNNTRQVTITGVVGLPDLVVESLTYAPARPTVGTTLTFQITVRNQGGASAGLFYISISGLAGTQYAQVSNLAAGDRVTVSLALPLSAATETFTATADATNRVREADEGNNFRQITVTAAPPPLSLSISTDKTSYTVGEAVRITLNVSQPSHVYVVELDAANRAILLFPNFWERDPRLPAGTTVLPRLGTYQIRATEPTGTDRFFAFAADRPIAGFPTSFPTPSFPILATNGPAFLAQVRSWLSTNVPARAWAEASTQITVTPLANQPPVASFTFTPTNPLVNQWITFDATASRDPDGFIVAHRWDFGDGATATGVRVTKRYATAGTYTVTLTVTDNRGATGTTTRTVVVGTPNQAPTASFTFTPTNPNPGENVVFNAEASSDPDGTITAYSWSFGDGTTGTGMTITKAYAAAGTYTVTLTVTDNLGATGTATRTIQVGPPPLTLPGMPVIDRPGIYVWGDPEYRWHVTVAGSAAWPSARPFRVVLSSHGTFTDVAVTPGTAPAPTISADRRSIRWEGTIGAGWVDLRFRLTGSGSWILHLELYLDLDGDGDPVPRTAAEARSMVFLRAKKVNPPHNPMLFLIPEGEIGAVLPVHNFRIAQGTLFVHFVTTTIEALEGGP
jgi:PKD repeat protein